MRKQREEGMALVGLGSVAGGVGEAVRGVAAVANKPRSWTASKPRYLFPSLFVFEPERQARIRELFVLGERL